MRRKIILEEDENPNDIEGIYNQLKYLQNIKDGGGDLPSLWYPNWFDDELVYDIKKTSNDWDVEIRFGDNNFQFWDIFPNFNDGDYDRILVESLFSSYGSHWDFISEDTIYDDIKEGYYPSIFNGNEVKTYIKDIVMIMAPELLPCLGDREENDRFGRSDLCEELIIRLLMNEFESELDSILSNYVSEQNATIANNMKKYVIENHCSLETIGFDTQSCFYKYTIPLSTLIEKFEEYGKTNSSVFDLISQMVIDENVEVPSDLQEDYYSYLEENVALTESEPYTISQLQNMLSKVEDMFEDVDVYRENFEWVSSKFPMHKLFKTKWDDAVKVRIDGIDRETNKILVYLEDMRDPNNPKKKSSELTREELNLLVYQPKLF